MKAGVREAVMRRDGRCVLSFLEEGHECRDRWGVSHAPDVIDALTLEHVKPNLAMGIRKLDDPRWCVALCGAANNRPPTKEQREKMRAYLAETVWVDPPCICNPELTAKGYHRVECGR